MMKTAKIFRSVLAVMALVAAAPVHAQVQPAIGEVAPEQETLQQVAPADSEIPASAALPASDSVASDSVASDEAVPAMPQVFEGGINPNEINPIVFSYWERAAINDARNYRGQTRAPTEEELMRGIKTPGEQKVKPPPEEREIKLGGIVFVDAADWAIWLNGKRVTPTAIPREVMDLKVYKEYVEMKWFDDYTNQIFPLRIRAHERFNIDSRIFLPG